MCWSFYYDTVQYLAVLVCSPLHIEALTELVSDQWTRVDPKATDLHSELTTDIFSLILE